MMPEEIGGKKSEALLQEKKNSKGLPQEKNKFEKTTAENINPFFDFSSPPDH